MRTAKIQLQADIKGFTAAIDEAKKAVAGIGDMDISSDAGDKLKKMFSDDLVERQKAVQAGIKKITNELMGMSSASGEAFDPEKFSNATQKLNKYNRLLKDINDTMGQLQGKKFPETPTGGSGRTGILGRMGGMGRMLGGVAAAVGVRSAYNRRVGMARERMDTMGLTTDARGLGEEESQYGFTTQERRRRATELARQGGSLSGAQVESLTDISEQVQRAFGITEEQSAGAVGAARRAGVEDQGKYLAQTIGTAQAAGLEGSKIGEFLSAQTSYLEEMSKGMDINEGSLRGMAGALGSLPFFQNDPNRIFEALRSMDSAFRSGDRFQQAQATRAILQTAPGSSPAATEFRRRMGLFGEIDDKTLGKLRDTGMDTSALETSGGSIVSNIFKEIMATTQGMRPEDQMFEFMERTGLDAGPAAEIFAGLKSGDMNIDEITKKMQEANMSPEDRLNQTMGSLEGRVLDLDATMSKIGDQIASNIAEPFINLGNKIDDLIAQLGGDTSDIGAGVGTAAALLGGAAMLGGGGMLGGAAGKAGDVIKGAGKGIKNAGKGANRLFTAARKGGRGGFNKATGRMFGKKFGQKVALRGATAGAGAVGVGGAAVPLAGAALTGVAIGEGVNYLTDPNEGLGLGASENRYGQKSSMFEKGIGAFQAYANPFSDFTPEQYDSIYGSEGADPLMPDAKFDAPGMPQDKMPSNVIPMKKPDASTGGVGGFKMPSIDFGSNNAALADNTTAIAQLTTQLAKNGGRRGMPSSANVNRRGATVTGKGF